MGVLRGRSQFFTLLVSHPGAPKFNGRTRPRVESGATLSSNPCAGARPGRRRTRPAPVGAGGGAGALAPHAAAKRVDRGPRTGVSGRQSAGRQIFLLLYMRFLSLRGPVRPECRIRIIRILDKFNFSICEDFF